MKWISVKDKLPPFDQHVLVINKYKEILIAYREKENFKEFWHYVCVCPSYEWDFIDKEVLYWMVLPEQPKE